MIDRIKTNHSMTPVAQLFKALNHPVRLAILEELRNGEACVCHLENRLGMRQAYISQQLAVLRDAGIVQDNRDGWNIYYAVVDERLFSLLERARNIAGVTGFVGDPEGEGVCPCPRCHREPT